LTRKKTADKLAKPPLSRVDLYVYFDTQLSVAERRSEYFNFVKNNYPLVNIPKIESLHYNYGDCNFFSKDYTNMIGIATNYFSFSTVRYNKFAEFYENFQKTWEEFKKLFSINQVKEIILIYENRIAADKQIGYNFSDYFDINFNFPGHQEKAFLAVEGNFYFSVPSGIVKLDFKPIQVKERTVLEPDFSFILEFRDSFKDEKDKISQLAEVISKGHEIIDDIFFASLSDKYYQLIK